MALNIVSSDKSTTACDKLAIIIVDISKDNTAFIRINSIFNLHISLNQIIIH